MLALFLHVLPWPGCGHACACATCAASGLPQTRGRCPPKHEFHLSKEARRARDTPQNPRKMFRDTEDVFFLRYFCTSWPGLDAGMCLLALGLRLLAWFRSEESAPSSRAPQDATKTSRDTEACFCLRYFRMSWPGLGTGMFALALEYRKASETRG